MNLLVGGASLGHELESAGRFLRLALRNQTGCRSKHSRAPQVRNVILVPTRPVFVTVLRQQSLSTPRGDIEQQVRVVRSQGLVECCFEVLDVGAQYALWAECDNAVSQSKHVRRRPGDRQRTTRRMQCLMQIVGRRRSPEVWPKRLDNRIAVHAMALSESQQFQQRARLAEPPGACRNGNAVHPYVESAQQLDANLLWRHVLSVPFLHQAASLAR